MSRQGFQVRQLFIHDLYIDIITDKIFTHKNGADHFHVDQSINNIY
jgi:hypothetical protein